MEGEALVMTKGSRYRIISLFTRNETLESIGTFKGYVAVGADDGICLELGEEHGDLKGVTRILPTHMITAIDVLETAREDNSKEIENTAVYFG